MPPFGFSLVWFLKSFDQLIGTLLCGLFACLLKRGLVGPLKPANKPHGDATTITKQNPDDIVPVMSTSTTPYTLAEIAKHNTDKDCWVIIDGKVYDSTEWLKDHPGGKAIIMGIAGQDATKQFDALHSKRTKKKLLKGKFATQVGVLASARL